MISGVAVRWVRWFSLQARASLAVAARVQAAAAALALCAAAAVVLFAAVALAPTSAQAQALSADVSAPERGATIVHLLDYVAVDYPEFVKDGKVLDEAEYTEQLEFVGQAIASLERMPDNPLRTALLDQARALLAQVQAKAAGDAVSAASNQLKLDVIAAYRLTVAPRAAPKLAEEAKT